MDGNFAKGLFLEWELSFYLPIIIIILLIVLAFIKAFLVQITLINSVLLGSLSGSILYCCNRYNDVVNINLPFDKEIHPAICLAVGISICIVTALIRRTKVGFWIFAVIFSIGWSLLLALFIDLFLNDRIWFWTIFGIATVINFTSHIRSRNLRVDIAKSLMDVDSDDTKKI